MGDWVENARWQAGGWVGTTPSGLAVDAYPRFRRRCLQERGLCAWADQVPYMGTMLSRDSDQHLRVLLSSVEVCRCPKCYGGLGLIAQWLPGQPWERVGTPQLESVALAVSDTCLAMDAPSPVTRGPRTKGEVLSALPDLREAHGKASDTPLADEPYEPHASREREGTPPWLRVALVMWLLVMVLWVALQHLL